MEGLTADIHQELRHIAKDDIIYSHATPLTPKGFEPQESCNFDVNWARSQPALSGGKTKPGLNEGNDFVSQNRIRIRWFM
jgi:hypothetical protein